jgi:hypothetical protein
MMLPDHVRGSIGPGKQLQRGEAGDARAALVGNDGQAQLGDAREVQLWLPHHLRSDKAVCQQQIPSFRPIKHPM